MYYGVSLPNIDNFLSTRASISLSFMSSMKNNLIESSVLQTTMNAIALPELSWMKINQT